MEDYIVVNQIKCLKCGDTPYSTHSHDYRLCECRKCGVDGGQEYLKRIGKDWEEMSIVMPRAAVDSIVDEVTGAIESGRNPLGVTLAAIRGLRDIGQLKFHN